VTSTSQSISLTETRTHSVSDQITQIAGNAATHDAKGNLTDYEINIKTYEVEYDLDNRIIKVDVDNNDVEYRYDALGRRVIRKEGSDKTALLWWGNSECAEYEHGAGQSCIQNDIMSHPSRLNSVIARAVDGSKFDLEWYHKNYLDHVYAVSDDTGNLDEHYRYTAFGEVTIYNGTGTIKTTSQINNTIMWNTRRLDTVSGYYLYKYRHYDPALGRWPSRDPIGENGGINLYAFLGNDALNYWDLLGNEGCKIVKLGKKDATINLPFENKKLSMNIRTSVSGTDEDCPTSVIVAFLVSGRDKLLDEGLPATWIYVNVFVKDPDAVVCELDYKIISSRPLAPSLDNRSTGVSKLDVSGVGSSTIKLRFAASYLRDVTTNEKPIKPPEGNYGTLIDQDSVGNKIPKLDQAKSAGFKSWNWPEKVRYSILSGESTVKLKAYCDRKCIK